VDTGFDSPHHIRHGPDHVAVTIFPCVQLRSHWSCYWHTLSHVGDGDPNDAGLSDWLDGYVARRFNQQSKLGSYLDPIADKVLLGCVVGALGFQVSIVTTRRSFLAPHRSC